jgi:hypothetical protein
MCFVWIIISKEKIFMEKQGDVFGENGISFPEE